MARRRELKSIASGIALHCVSRNNDISGYWALGILYRLAINCRTDLLSIVISLDDHQPVLTLFRRHIRNLFGSTDHPLWRFVSDLTIDFKFEPYPRDSFRRGVARVTCTVHILDDLGIRRSGSAVSDCRPHDPTFEHRSNRAEGHPPLVLPPPLPVLK